MSKWSIFRTISEGIHRFINMRPKAWLFSGTWLIIRGSLVRAQLGPQNISRLQDITVSGFFICIQFAFLRVFYLSQIIKNSLLSSVFKLNTLHPWTCMGCKGSSVRVRSPRRGFRRSELFRYIVLYILIIQTMYFFYSHVEHVLNYFEGNSWVYKY